MCAANGKGVVASGGEQVADEDGVADLDERAICDVQPRSRAVGTDTDERRVIQVVYDECGPLARGGYAAHFDGAVGGAALPDEEFDIDFREPAPARRFDAMAR